MVSSTTYSFSRIYSSPRAEHGPPLPRRPPEGRPQAVPRRPLHLREGGGRGHRKEDPGVYIQGGKERGLVFLFVSCSSVVHTFRVNKHFMELICQFCYLEAFFDDFVLAAKGSLDFFFKLTLKSFPHFSTFF